MPPLPVVSGKEALAAFEQLGWRFKRRESSHMMLTKPGSSASSVFRTTGNSKQERYAGCSERLASAWRNL
jgi:predicted RNA binding protein YcfA (HicA-like mRNA interferase family)